MTSIYSIRVHLAFTILSAFLMRVAVATEPTPIPSSVEESSPTKIYEELFEQSIKDIDAQFTTFELKRSEVASALTELYSLAKRIGNLNQQIYSSKKKLDEAGRSIILKESEDLERKRDAIATGLITQYGIPFFIIVGLKEIDSLAKKGRITERDLLSVTRNSSLGRKPELRLACIKHDPFSDRKCLENLLNVCMDLFGSRTQTLTYTYWNDDLEKEETTLLTPSEVASAVGKNFSGGEEFQGIKNLFVQLYTGICGSLASKGYAFSQSRIGFIDQKEPTWFREVRFSYPYNPASFESSCIPVSSERRNNLASALWGVGKNGFLEREFKSATEGVKRCDKYIAEACKNFEPLAEGRVARHYPTVGCEVRAVTIADIRRDVARWEQSSDLTEADRLKHEEMIQEISFCEMALKADFSWVFLPPKPTCKKK